MTKMHRSRVFRWHQEGGHEHATFLSHPEEIRYSERCSQEVAGFHERLIQGGSPGTTGGPGYG